MKIICLFVPLILFLRKSYEFDSKIIGGTDVVLPVKYQISVRDHFNRHLCGGVIIKKRWTLTCAHCLLRDDVSYIGIGSINLYSKIIIYEIHTIIIHPSYNQITAESDIGLLKINIDMEFNKYIWPVKLPVKQLPVGLVYKVSGWGFISNNGSISSVLQILSVKSISIEKCINIMNSSRIIDNRNLCTLSDIGKGVCNGDFGGPLVRGLYLYGIVSWGRHCADGYPDIYIRIYPYKKWIIDTINNNSLD